MNPNDAESAKRIAEIMERCEKATAGPWYQLRDDARVPVMDDSKFPESLLCETADGYYAFTWAKDCNFTTHARSDIPWLLSRVTALEDELKRQGEWFNEFQEVSDYISSEKWGPFIGEKPSDALIGYIKSLEAKLAEAETEAQKWKHLCNVASECSSDYEKDLGKCEQELSTLRRQVEEAKALLMPFAACAAISSRIASIPPDKHWLWKPSSNTEELPGISLAHCDAAERFINQLPTGKEKG